MMMIFNKYFYHKPNSCPSHRNRVWRNLRKTKAGSLDPTENLGSDCSRMCSPGPHYSTMRLMTFTNISSTRSLPAPTESSYVPVIGMSSVWAIESVWLAFVANPLLPGKARLEKPSSLPLFFPSHWLPVFYHCVLWHISRGSCMAVSSMIIESCNRRGP